MGAWNNPTLKMGRRQFLLAGSASLLTLTGGAGSARAAVASRAKIGYWQGAQSQDSPDAAFSPDVADASKIGPADASLADAGVLAVVHGLAGEPPAADISLSALYLVGTAAGPRTLAYHAWSYRHGAAGQASPAVQFTLPVAPSRGIRLTVELRSPSRADALRHGVAPTPVREEMPVDLLLDGADGSPALKTGAYFIALSGSNAAESPQWDRYQFRAGSGGTAIGNRRLYQKTALGIEEVQFPYLVLSIDHAPDAPRD